MFAVQLLILLDALTIFEELRTLIVDVVVLLIGAIAFKGTKANIN